MTLAELGWSNFFAQQVQDSESELQPARVCRQDINQYHLITEDKKLTAKLPGKLWHSAQSKSDLPTVGDWVLTSAIPGGEPSTVRIERLLKRKSKFSRQIASDKFDEQVVAANIDTVFVVSGLDDEFNPARIERYLTLSMNSGVATVILLNKADISLDHTAKLNELQPIAKNTPSHLISAKKQMGLDAIRQYIGVSDTCAFIGSSGVGKSTIINSLVGHDHFKTAAVRASDSRGRHTTTFRELVAVPGHGLVIDTPGMRELQIWTDPKSGQSNFEDITEIASQCKFSDCKHDSEPNCAIRKAISEGRIDDERLQRYKKLNLELDLLKAHQENIGSARKNHKN